MIVQEEPAGLGATPTHLEHPTVARIEDQINWYDLKSTYNQRWYKRLKIGVLVAAAAIPFAAGFAPQWVSGLLGAFIVVTEGSSSSTNTRNTGSPTARLLKR
jgi:hypothetical protein